MIRAVVTDIEGTTSSLSFVKDVLFPYARQHIADFVQCHYTDSAVRACLDDINRIVGSALDLDGAIQQLIDWIDTDQKITPLKTLQGMLWQEGYQKGDFLGHVYEDAYRNLLHWQQRGLRLYVFSSGSVLAQKLLFTHTAYGDMTPLFSAYWDTHIGGKRETKSYSYILHDIALSADEVVFLSDIKEELDAAKTVGMRTYWLVRDKAFIKDSAHVQASDFDQILL